MNSLANDAITTPARAAATGDKKTVAVIDVGSTSLRMAVAEISSAGNITILETLSQAVGLGKDTFTRGTIQRSTIEDCARSLKSYRRVLEEYGVVDTNQIRVVATSAVREASNRLAFLDRIYVATGLEVQPLDEAEVNRITFFGIQSFLKSQPDLAEARLLVIEVGGGSTDVLLVESGRVTHSHSYRLGATRLRESLQQYRGSSANVRRIMESQVDLTVEQIISHVPRNGNLQMVALGGDVRFAANQLLPEWNRDEVVELSVDRFAKLTDKMLPRSPDELVQKYHLTFPNAESLGPALLAYLKCAIGLRLKNLLVANVNLRDGLLTEMATAGVWTDEFSSQITRSALDLGRKFCFDEEHSTHVAKLSREIFHSLQDEHELSPRYGVLLYIAALLHEIGLFVGTAAHHKHSMYLINNSELFGLSRNDVLLVALVARYHRRASPKPTHTGYGTINREDRIAVSKMSAILRVADALDRSHSQRVESVEISHEDGRLIFTASDVADLSLEQLALNQKGSLFEETYGLKVLLRAGQSSRGS